MSYEALKSKYQRDINRILDADRLIRKKGLQKLLEELPWNIPEQFASLDLLFSHDLLVHLFSIIADPVEKCREISIQILLKYIEICNDVSPFASNLISVISQRIGDNPFPEPAEELRLQSAIVLENLLKKIYTQNCIQQQLFPYSNLLQALPKALTDSFPAAKKQLADVTVIICQFPNFTNKVNSKNIVKALSSNCLHQHSKVRIASIKVACLLDRIEFYLFIDTYSSIFSNSLYV
jgi:dynein assembly factor 5